MGGPLAIQQFHAVPLASLLKVMLYRLGAVVARGYARPREVQRILSIASHRPCASAAGDMTRVIRTVASGLTSLSHGLNIKEKLYGQTYDPEIHLKIGGKNFKKPKAMSLNAWVYEQKGKIESLLACKFEDTIVSYFEGDIQITIMDERDWQGLYESGCKSKLDKLTLYICSPDPGAGLITVLQAREPTTYESLSAKGRKFFKKLLNSESATKDELQKVTAKLEARKYRDFSSNAVVWEERGMSKEDWAASVKKLEVQGLAPEIGEAWKLALNNTGGSKKSTYTSVWLTPQSQATRKPWENENQNIPDKKQSRRMTYYTMFQVIPIGNSRFDILVALNQNVCFIDEEGMKNPALTGVQAEQDFSDYIELDSSARFKKKVQLLLEDSDSDDED